MKFHNSLAESDGYRQREGRIEQAACCAFHAAGSRANRLLSTGGSAYQYDGLGNRIQQTADAIVTRYLLDLQPGLAVVLRQSDGTDTNHYIHSLRGIHAMQGNPGNWVYAVQDGLGSVRVEADSLLDVQFSQNFAPYLSPMDVTGTAQLPFGATGEQVDSSELLYLRARYYSPSLGIFPSLDPLETPNRYAYVAGNPVNLADPSGLQGIMTSPFFDPYGLAGGGDGYYISPHEAAKLLQQILRLATVAVGIYSTSTSVGAVANWPAPNQNPGDVQGDFWELCNTGLCYGTLFELLRRIAENLPQHRVIPDERTQPRHRDDEETCDPVAFEAWWKGLKPVSRSYQPDTSWYKYEQRVARGDGKYGDYTREVLEGPIHADGIEPSRCHLVDAKYAKNPRQPQYRLDGPPWVDSESNDVIALVDELTRYKSAVDNGEPMGLTIRTNAELSVPLFASLLVEVGFMLNVDGVVEYVP